MRKNIIVTMLLLGGMNTLVIAADNVTQTENTTSPSAVTTPAPAPTPAQQPETNVQLTPAAAPQPINCNYKIAPEQTDIKPDLIQAWVKFATQKSFNMDATQLNQQMESLKICFTKQGWEGFQTALDKSGNLKAIKQQKLAVTSQVDGPVDLSQVKANQWKATLPVTVTYQNDKQRLTQLLSVDVMIGRKISGDLGIMQMIATPRVAGESNSQNASPAN